MTERVERSHPCASRNGVDLLVVNKADQQLGLIDLVAGEQIRVISLSENTGHEVSVSTDGRIAYVPIYSDAAVGEPGFDGRSIDVIDLCSASVRRSHDLGESVRPHCIVTGRDGLLYVTAENADQVHILDEGTLDLVTAIPTGADQSHMLAVSTDRRIACTSNIEPGSVSVLDLTTRTLRGVVPVAARINRIALSPDGRVAYTADQTDARIAVVDTDDLRVREWIPLPGIGFGSALTPDGRLVIALRAANAVAILHPADPRDIELVPVPAGPQAIVLDDTQNRAYTACHIDEVVVELDLASAHVTRVIPVGSNPDGLCLVPAPLAR